MKLFHTKCPEHGDVDLTPLEINVVLWASNSKAQYRFACPKDRMTILKDTESRITDLLILSGAVMYVIWDTFMDSDREQDGIMREKYGPLDWDELIDFHQDLKELGKDIMAGLLPYQDSL